MDRLIPDVEIKLHLGSLLFDGFPSDKYVDDIFNYYKTAIIPQKIKEAEKKLIEEIERDGKCGNGDIDFPLAEWNKLKRSMGGIE